MKQPGNPVNDFAASRRGRLLLILALLLNVTLATSSAFRKSVTVDEFALLPNGIAILQAQAFHIDRGVGPLPKILFALPVVMFSSAEFDTSDVHEYNASWRSGRQFLDQNREGYHRYFMIGRGMSIFVLLATCLLAYGFARSLYGPGGALITVLMVSLSPNLLAHGRLVTTDIYFTAAVVGSLWAFDGFLRKPGLVRAFAWGSTLGLAVLCKFTGLLLFIIYPVAALCMYAMRRATVGESGPAMVSRRRTILWGIAAFAVALVVINLGYFGHGSGTLLGDYSFTTSTGQALQHSLPAWLPVPLPSDLVLGCDTQLAEKGYDAYLLGEFNTVGFWNYFLVGFLVKTPVPVLVLALLALALKPKITVREVPMLLLGLSLLAFFSLAGHKNIGIRYLLFIIPITCVWIGRIASSPMSASKKYGRIPARIVGVGAVWLLAGTVIIWPDYLAYFNIASGGPAQGHKYLLDSNIDWGQDLIALRKYMEKNQIASVDLAYFGRVLPEVYGIKYQHLIQQPTQRYAVVSANLLWGRMYFVNGTGFWPTNRDRYAPLRELRPVAVLGHSLYVFDLSNQEKR